MALFNIIIASIQPCAFYIFPFSLAQGNTTLPAPLIQFLKIPRRLQQPTPIPAIIFSVHKQYPRIRKQFLEFFKMFFS